VLLDPEIIAAELRRPDSADPVLEDAPDIDRHPRLDWGEPVSPASIYSSPRRRVFGDTPRDTPRDVGADDAALVAMYGPGYARGEFGVAGGAPDTGDDATMRRPREVSNEGVHEAAERRSEAEELVTARLYREQLEAEAALEAELPHAAATAQPKPKLKEPQVGFAVPPAAAAASPTKAALVDASKASARTEVAPAAGHSSLRDVVKLRIENDLRNQISHAGEGAASHRSPAAAEAGFGAGTEDESQLKWGVGLS